VLFRRRPAAREVSPLAVYRAERVVITVHEVVPWSGRGAPVTPLELYGAVVTEDLSGRWVYAFQDLPGSRWSDGRVFYAGQTENLYTRWRDHYYRFGERFTAAVKWRVPVVNEPEADLRELTFINFYEPECNDKGRAADLEAKVRRWARGTKEFDAAVRRRSLDSKQAGT
jgi:predicted GIY-YIG superfamily endonuclease